MLTQPSTHYGTGDIKMTKKEMEAETRPLLEHFRETPRKSLCRRIPCEIAVTGAILGAFLLVVTLLIVLENLKSSSDDQLLLVKSDLAKNNQKPLASLLKKSKFTDYEDAEYIDVDDPSLNNKDKNKDKSKRKTRKPISSTESHIDNEDKYSDEVHDIMIDPVKDEGENKHEKITNTIDLFEMELKNSINLKLNPLEIKELIDYLKNYINDWRYKFLEEAIETEEENELIEDSSSDSTEDSDSDEISKKLLRSPFKYNKKIMDDSWQKGDHLSDPTFDHLFKIKAHLFAKMQEIQGKLTASETDEIASHNGCPFKHSVTGLEDSELMQAYIDCAHIVEEMHKSYGDCIDLSFLPKECKPTWSPKCLSTYQYRKIDGACNNRIHPTWGRSSIPFVRMIAPDYGDGASSVRLSKDGSELPNARLLSRELYSKQLKQDIDQSLLFLYFGLFIDHDMIETALNTDSIPCCNENLKKNPLFMPRECLQIEIPKGDPFYGPKNIGCLDFVRSIPVQGECIGRREQLNKATSFLDGSAIYGSTVGRAKAIRSFSKGLLKTQRINDNPFMTYSDDAGYTCGTASEPLKCFAAGDSRVNMMVDLTAMHTLWYREHNRIADKLYQSNPQWTDEKLYQESRRTVIAELQHIVYNEFLPTLLGEDAMEYFELKINSSVPYDGYDETINPSVFNVMGSAAFRFGHSLVQDALDLIGSDNMTKAVVPLHETFFNNHLIHNNALDLLVRGAALQKLHSVDSYMTHEVREHLFQPSNKDFGRDLGAIGIQRGRDHGLPSYTKWRSVCGLPEIRSWEDLYDIMDPERAMKLQEVYKYVEDIDLIPGALAESTVEESLLGPTYLCVIGRQFKKTRKGDRFWYEQQNSEGSLTGDQLKEVYKSNMARIICDNSDNIKQMQQHVFRVPSPINLVVDCESLPKLDLSVWSS